VSVFPQVPLTFAVEMYLNGLWTNLVPLHLVHSRDPITATRGRSANAQVADPSTGSVSLKNADGRFAPRNPNGAYYGKFGRNSPLRLRVGGLGPVRLLAAPDGVGGGASAADSVALSITGDIDIRWEGWLPSWYSTPMTLVGKDDVGSPGNYSWRLVVSDASFGAGSLGLLWSETGAGPTWGLGVSLPPPFYGHKAVRVTLDVNNGAGGATATFYTAPTLAGSWTSIGSHVLGATTSIFDSASPVFVQPATGASYGFELRNGIAGSVVANPDFTAATTEASSYTDPHSVGWSAVNGEYTNRRSMMTGEVAEWPVRWDSTGRDVYTTVAPTGILRRLAQGKTLRSPLNRANTLHAAGIIQAYWPCEDASQATRIASGLATGGPMIYAAGVPSFGGCTDFAASAPVLQCHLAQIAGPIPTYAGTPAVGLRFLISVPVGGTVNNAVVARLVCTGTATRWELVYTTASGGSLTVNAYAKDNSSLLSSAFAVALNGHPAYVSLGLVPGGGNVQWQLTTLRTDGVYSDTGLTVLAGRTIGTALHADMNTSLTMDDVGIGHIAVTISGVTDQLLPLAAALTGYVGESAGVRITRLCAEEGVPFVPYGKVDVAFGTVSQATMGVQPVGALLDLLRECAEADGGVLFEPGDRVGLAYRPPDALYNQSAAVALDYAAGQLDGLDPTDDDQLLANLVTVTRAGGSSVAAELTTGALSTADPPAGVGVYDKAATLNIDDDALLDDQAWWRVHLGTADTARYPQIPLNLASAALTAALTLRAAVVDAEVGDVITIANPPAWLPPETIRTMVAGFSVSAHQFGFDWVANCVPGDPWTVAAYDDSLSRYTSDGSYMGDGLLNTTATSFHVTTLSGPLWSHSDGDFDIRLGGERMTVTAVTGTTSPQTFTVTRSVNGVVAGHALLDPVELWSPAVYAL
jgi:hypothetical protein